MRSTVIISKRGGGYIATLSGKFGGGFQGARCGLTPFDAATKAAEWMIIYAQSNDEGGDLMAPPEVIELVPTHLHSIQAKKQGPEWHDPKELLENKHQGFCWIETINIADEKLVVVAWCNGESFVSIDGLVNFATDNISMVAKITPPKDA